MVPMGMVEFLNVLVLIWGSNGPGDLVIEDPWIREGAPGQPMLAGYVTLANDSDVTQYLVAQTAEGFGSVSVHRTEQIDGVSRMREVPRLTLPAGETVEMAPGGLHLMLMRPKAPVRAGDRVEILMEFEPAGVRRVDFEVRGLDDGG